MPAMFAEIVVFFYYHFIWPLDLYRTTLYQFSYPPFQFVEIHNLIFRAI